MVVRLVCPTRGKAGTGVNSSAPRFPPPAVPGLSLSLVPNIFPAISLSFRQVDKNNALQVSKFSLDLHSKSMHYRSQSFHLTCTQNHLSGLKDRWKFCALKNNTTQPSSATFASCRLTCKYLVFRGLEVSHIYCRDLVWLWV